jgi:3',5'-cyclic AMP phosphodiesterase CpdA
MTWPLTLLHLSDLHFGPHGRFAGEDKKALAERFHQALEQAREDLGWKEPVGLCLITGDVAEAARPQEYKEALEFFTALADFLRLSRERLIFVPGNHDVSWDNTEQLKIEQRKRGFSDDEYERRSREQKFEFFDGFLRDFHGTSREQLPNVKALGHGAFVHSFPDERLAIAVLNSSERESHLHQGGALSREQAQALMSQWTQGEALSWVKLVAIHHNPVATVPSNVRSWVQHMKEAQREGKLKPETIDHFASDAVGFDGTENLRAVATDCQIQFVLHGHHHAADRVSWPWRKAVGHTHVLSAGSWGLSPSKLPEEQPNMIHLVRIDPTSQQAQSVLRIFEPRARATGHVQPGHFVVDPAEPEGVSLPLSLPQAFPRGTPLQKKQAPELGEGQEPVQDSLLRTLERLIRPESYRTARRQRVFETVFEPSFEDLRKVHSDYINMFYAVQKQIPPYFMQNDPRYADQLKAAVEQLREMRIKFSPIRVELRKLAEKLRLQDLDPLARDFAEALLNYFPDGALRDPLERRDAGWWASASTSLMERIYESSWAPEKQNPAELVQVTIATLETAWRSVCDAYQALRLDIHLGDS